MGDKDGDATTRTWQRKAWVALAVAALLIGWVVWRGGAPDETADVDPTGDATTPATEPAGLVVIDGQVIEPPFEVAAPDGEVVINGVPLRDSAIPTPADVAATTTDTVDVPPEAAIVERVAERYQELGGPTDSPPSPTVVDTLVTEALDSGLMVSATRNGPRLEMVDASGRPWSVLLQKQPFDPAEQPERDEAAVLRDLLDSGGTILASGELVVSVPVGAGAFIDELADALQDGDEERVAALLYSDDLADTLLGPDTVARLRAHSDEIAARDAEVAAAAGRGDAAADSDTGRRAPAAVRRSADGATMTLASQSTNSAVNRTPTQPFAFLFTPITVEGGVCWYEPVLEAAHLQGYVTYHFDGYASTLATFLASSGNAGVLYACMHGGNEYEVHPNRVSALRAYFTYQDLGIPAEQIFTAPDPETARWSLGTTLNMVRERWTSSQTVIHMDSCGTSSVQSPYRAREFVASKDTVCPLFSYARNHAFWGRLAGVTDDGESRTVREAFDAAFDTDLWELAGRGRGRTVLAPGVERVQLAAQLPAPGTTTGTIEFDAAMAPSVDPLLLTTIGPCGATVQSMRWTDDHTLGFTLQLSSPGELILAVNSNHAVSADEPRLVLDGNRVPDGRNRVGPNRDDHTTLVDCVAAAGTPSQPPSGSPTATDRPASGAPGIEVALLSVGSKNDTYLATEGGRPVAGATIRVTTADGAEVGSGTTDAAGRFVIDLPAGDYVVQWFEYPPHVYIEPGCDRAAVTVTDDGRATAMLFAFDESHGPNDNSTEGYTYGCPQTPPG